MKVLWKNGDLTAKRITEILSEMIGWNRNTTYTVIKKCISKGAIERREPNFVCHALLSEEEAQTVELDNLIENMFDGRTDLLFASLLNRQNLPDNVIAKLRTMIDGEK
jgi:predicted transcriptional regulator